MDARIFFAHSALFTFSETQMKSKGPYLQNRLQISTYATICELPAVTKWLFSKEKSMPL